MNSDFLDSLANHCKEKACLHFRTDHEEYFEWTQEVLLSLGSWHLASGVEWPFERETVFQAKVDFYQSMILEKT